MSARGCVVERSARIHRAERLNVRCILSLFIDVAMTTGGPIGQVAERHAVFTRMVVDFSESALREKWAKTTAIISSHESLKGSFSQAGSDAWDRQRGNEASLGVDYSAMGGP